MFFCLLLVSRLKQERSHSLYVVCRRRRNSRKTNMCFNALGLISSVYLFFHFYICLYVCVCLISSHIIPLFICSSIFTFVCVCVCVCLILVFLTIQSSCSTIQFCVPFCSKCKFSFLCFFLHFYFTSSFLLLFRIFY